jgi:nucleoside 2-deoxyribosyltransferase
VKIYLAAKFEHKNTMRDVANLLTSRGHEITSRWIRVEHHEDTANTVTDELRVQYAAEDVEDVRRADLLVAFAHPRHEPGIGGGRHVEFGIALERDMPIIVIGPKGEHIFHWWPGVRHVDDIVDLIELLKDPEAIYDDQP